MLLFFPVRTHVLQPQPSPKCYTTLPILPPFPATQIHLSEQMPAFPAQVAAKSLAWLPQSARQSSPRPQRNRAAFHHLTLGNHWCTCSWIVASFQLWHGSARTTNCVVHIAATGRWEFNTTTFLTTNLDQVTIPIRSTSIHRVAMSEKWISPCKKAQYTPED